MIDSKELRIGNIVSLPGSVFTELYVKAVDTEYVTLRIAPDRLHEDIVTHYKQIEPIPISPEWIDRFGFVSYYGQMVKDFGDGSLIIYDQFDDNDPTMTISVFNQYDDSGCKLPHIKYIHQLMNLFYALTGEELQIKEKTN